MSLQSMRRWEPHFPVIKRVAAKIQSIILDNNGNVSHWSVYNGLSDLGSCSGWENFSFRRMTAMDWTKSLSVAKGRPSCRQSRWPVAPVTEHRQSLQGLRGWGCEECLLCLEFLLTCCIGKSYEQRISHAGRQCSLPLCQPSFDGHCTTGFPRTSHTPQLQDSPSRSRLHVSPFSFCCWNH